MGAPQKPYGARLRRERRTIAAMYRIYCRHHHRQHKGLCPECQSDLDYCLHRIDKCPYGETKPTCKNCVTHCYSPKMQERVKAVMRFSGPKMLTRHPIQTILHLYWDGRIQPEPKKVVRDT